MPLYHRDVFVPDHLTLPAGVFNLRYYQHAVEIGQRKNIPLIGILDTSKAKAIEMETDNHGKLKKVVYRLSYDETHDLCLAVETTRQVWWVRTMWKNRVDDNHETLNTDKYDCR